MWMRRVFVRPFVLALFSVSFGVTSAQTVRVDIVEAEAIEKNTDTVCGFLCPWWNQQDFFNRVTMDTDLTVQGPLVDQRDLASWSPPFSVQSLLDPYQRVMPVEVKLFDDDAVGEAQFDIDFFPGDATLNLVFDACLGVWSDGDETYGPVRAPSADDPRNQVASVLHRRGYDSDPAQMRMGLSLEGNIPALPDDVMIVGAGPVQVVTGPRYVVAGKQTTFRLDLASSWDVDRTATATVTVTDQISTWTQTRGLFIPPGESTHYFFHENFSERPFIPQKQPNFPYLTWTVSMDVEGEVTCIGDSGDPSYQPWGCCNLENNSVVTGLGNGAKPVKLTHSPRTVYMPFDWITPSTPDEPADADLLALIDVTERFREATFPIAEPVSHERILPSEFVLRDTPGGCPFGFCAEPYATAVKWSVPARRAGIDTLILSVAPGWIGRRIDAGETVGFLSSRRPSGMTLGEFSPNCVISEAEPRTVGVHEIAHTFELSQRDCVPDDEAMALLETLFPTLGCRDEYMFTSGRPYLGEGYDVKGLVYPNGFSGPGELWPGEPQCGPVTPFSREVKCATNLMDRSTPRVGVTAIENWIDAFSYDFLTEKLILPGDPTAVEVRGMLHTPTGHDSDPPVYTGELAMSYIFDGIPDMPEPLVGDESGSGFFALRFVTPQGSRTYRFDPHWVVDESEVLDTTYVALLLAWDDTTSRIELLGPADASNPAQNQDIVLAAIDRSPQSPAVGNLRVEGGAGQQTPVLGPGVTAELKWEVTDPDSPDTWAIVELLPPASNAPFAFNGPLPMAVDLTGGTFLLPHDLLQWRPGTWGARLTVTDGINTATTENAALVEVCNLTNSGAEICDGVDNDCNGLVDDVLAPPPALSGVVVDRTTLAWDDEPSAESYHIARGDLLALRELSGDFAKVPAACVAIGYPENSVDHAETPSVGDAWFYLVQGSNCNDDGSWDNPGPPPVTPRGPMIGTATLGCRPVCEHFYCTVGDPLTAGCSSCVQAVCQLDPYCCDTAWDSICVDEVIAACDRVDCPTASGSCDHGICSTGGPLTEQCDDPPISPGCVSQVCASDPRCCTTVWDESCAVRVGLDCGLVCAPSFAD